MNKVEIAGVNTSNLPLLSPEEKDILMKKIKDGDEKAREEFIRGNLRLVLSIIKRFYGKGENLDDLFQVGCIGLCKAVDNFDLSYNVRFSTYAVPMIIGEVRRYLRDDNMVRVSRSVKDLAYRTLKAKETFMLEHGRDATIDEISEIIGESAIDIICALEATRGTVSIFEPIYNDGGETIYLFDQIENKTEFKKDMIKNIMRADGFDNQTYKTKKLVLNMSGLVCGMVSVSIFASTMYSIDDSYKSIAFVFAAICAVLLYAGMYGIDKNSLKLFTAQYSKNVGIVYEYVITSDEIDVKVNDDNYIIPWDSVEKWCEDTESFYLFLKGGSNEKQVVPVCFVIGKKDFEGAKDFRELCTAVMAVRKGDNND